MDQQNQNLALLTLIAAVLGKEDHTKEGSLDLLVKALATSNTATLLTQPRGIFSTVGLENDILSTQISPMGIGAEIPAYPSMNTDPRYGIWTGYTSENGSRPSVPCADAPKGYHTAGTLTAAFGRVAHQTQTIEVDALFEQGRGVNTNLRLLGSVLGMNNMSLNMSQDQILDLVVKAEMVGVGVQFERDLAKLAWQGTPANNNVGGGHKEFPGMDSQIATGQVDAETNTALAAADSYIESFGYNLVGGTTRDIVEDLSMMEYYLFNLASRTGMAPVTWKLAMRPELWFEISAIYPCRYLTNRCSNAAGNNVVTINDALATQMRDQMRAGKYIDINGRRYSVVEDDGIFEHTNVNNANVGAGSYASSIYFVPTLVRGNFPVCYWEYKDYRGLSREVAPMGQGAGNLTFWTDTGKFMWAMRQDRYCFDLQAKCEPRIIQRVPWLAGKLQAVKYTPKRHLRSPFPDSPYYAAGGASALNVPTSYAVWK